MLRSFRVGNHRSIHAEQELILLPSSAKDGPALTVAGIFGANAAGKSNLLDALDFMKNAVCSSYGSWGPGAGVPRNPFRLAPEASAETSIFVVDVELDAVRFMYGFEVNDDEVQAEWLYSYPQNRRRVLFEREGESVSFGSTLREGRSRAKLLTQMMRSNALFLSLAAHADQKEVLPVYEWFQDRLQTRRIQPDGPALEQYVVAVYKRSPADRARLLSLVRAADLRVTGLHVDEMEIFGLREAKMYFRCGPDGVLLSFAEQSQGTRAWLSIAIQALAVLRDGGVLVVDELDASLHPRLAAQLIKMFRDEAMNPHAGQLIFTTHDATLLGTLGGEKTLARDHIWFVEKGREGSTTLFPLTDFHPRKDENIERRYLGGSYGAVPLYATEEFQELTESLRADRAEAS